MIRITTKIIFITFSLVYFSACQEDEIPQIEIVEYDNTPYALEYGNLPSPDLPSDNALTIEGVKLGRMLFYEKLLSRDNSQSCASCHVQGDGFSDKNQFSIGVNNLPGSRQAMSVFNLAWHNNGFLWDGKANRLRDQALLPIQDPLEMNETLENVIQKLSNTNIYPDQFVKAFDTEEITSEHMALALEQFMFSIVSSDSKYDKFLAGELELTESEERGRLLFETEFNPFFPEMSGADCAHCHGGANFENDQYMNNGLDTDAEITDLGREEITGNESDRAKFKVSSLRNIAVTAPYMHDGRFQTLEEVIDHYNEGIKISSTTDITLLNTEPTGLMLTDQDKTDLINFLHTLTDEVFLSNPNYASPF